VILKEVAATRSIRRIRKGGLFIVLASLCGSVHGVLVEDHDGLLLLWCASRPTEHEKYFSGDRDVPYWPWLTPTHSGCPLGKYIGPSKVFQRSLNEVRMKVKEGEGDEEGSARRHDANIL
jgi:hypothetical protein